MPDITMCVGTDCPIKETCYRFTATPEPLQSFFLKPPVKPDGTCQYRMDLNRSFAPREKK